MTFICAAPNQSLINSSEMYRTIIIKAIGIGGAVLVICGYYLLWISPDTEMSEVIIRTRYANMFNLFGGLMVVLYLFKRNS